MPPDSLMLVAVISSNSEYSSSITLVRSTGTDVERRDGLMVAAVACTTGNVAAVGAAAAEGMPASWLTIVAKPFRMVGLT